jgi:hypothetical protein
MARPIIVEMEDIRMEDISMEDIMVAKATGFHFGFCAIGKDIEKG